VTDKSNADQEAMRQFLAELTIIVRELILSSGRIDLHERLQKAEAVLTDAQK
jgi:hypothetical protein